MKLGSVRVGSIIICCKSTAEVLKHGSMGTKVKVLIVKADKGGNTGMTLGLQVWSSLTEVSLSEQNDRPGNVSAQTGTKYQ